MVLKGSSTEGYLMTGIAAVCQTLKLARRLMRGVLPVEVGAVQLVLPRSYAKGSMTGWPW
jgi:hypothetical protein